MTASGEQFSLRNAEHRAVVTEVGAALRSWSWRGRELLDGFPAEAMGDGHRGKVLAPWPNRVRDGRYAFRGAAHRLALTEPARGHALHGLAAWRPWRPVHRSAAAVTLALRLHPSPGYPFLVDLEAAYELDAGGLSLTLTAANAGDGPAPAGLGFHPYLAVGGGRVDAAELRLPAAAIVPVDDRLVPAGPPEPVDGTPYDLRGGRPIGDLVLDACFAAVEPDADGLARVRLAPPGAPAVTMWMDQAFGYVQAYTGDDDPVAARRRRSVAIEPMTCAPDAFNSGEGLAVLEPGASLSGRCGLQAA